MKHYSKLGLLVLLPSALVLGACSSSDSIDATPTPVAATLPAAGTPVATAVGGSVAAFIAFLQGLSGSDETSEPSPNSDGFAVPPDETNQTQTLS